MIKFSRCYRLGFHVAFWTAVCLKFHLLSVITVNNLDSCAGWKTDMAASPKEVLSKAFIDFALKLYKVVSEKQNNVLISPLSISTALSMALGGAKGNTLEQMKKALSIDSLEEILLEFPDLISHLNSANISDKVKIGNRIFLEEGFPVVDDFTRLTREVFQAEYGQVSFSKQPLAAKDVINTWVSAMTNGKISEVISDSIDPLTRLILVSAIYFKGLWAEQFSKHSTHIHPFHLDSKKSIKIKMMYLKKYYGLAHDSELKAKIIDLPYENNAFSMIIILPDEVEGLKSIEQQLDSMKLNQLLNEVKKHQRKVELYLPKFKLEESLELKPFLSALGMIDAFLRDKADFTGIESSGNLHVEKVVHKAFIDVNEEGTEAAAATAVRIVTRSLEILPHFKADHPFIFLIVENTRNLILFIGALKTPKAAKGESHEEL